MTRQEAYKFLGINQTANPEQIKKAYKTLAKKYHPDIYRGDKKFAEEKMKQINEAYTILSTPHTSTRTTSNSSEDYSRYYETGQRAYDDFMRKQKEEEERIRKQAEETERKIHEDIERLKRIIEERQKKMKILQKKLSIFLSVLALIFFCILITGLIVSATHILSSNQQDLFISILIIICILSVLLPIVFAIVVFFRLYKKWFKK